jgi:sugar lactone lactonase YvrE
MPGASDHVAACEIVAKGIYLEGLAADNARDTVWYSDVIAGGIHGLGRDKATVSLNASRMWTGGIMLNEDGAVLSSGQGGIMWDRPDTGASGWLIQAISGEPINGINEMVCDGHGGIFCGSVDLERIIAGQPSRPAALYHIAADGTARVAAEGLGFTNGLMLSRDGKKLYYNETFDGTYVFDVSPDLGLSGRRRLLAKRDCDGMALDAEGNLWITGYRSGEIVRMRPDGTMLDPLLTPAGGITQLRFGGSDMRDIWFTAVATDAGDRLATGELPGEANSFLYRSRSATPGLPFASARFKLG